MEREATTDRGATSVAIAFREFYAESGKSLLELVDASPTLLIFLRHFGCAFCRQTLDDVAQIREKLRERGVQPVFVHLGTPERAKPYLDHYQLSDAERVSNPDGSLYAHPLFHLPRIHPLSHLLRAAVCKSWIQGAIREHGIGMIREDGHQMPGLFFFHEGQQVRSYRYREISDRPDYLMFVE